MSHAGEAGSSKRSDGDQIKGKTWKDDSTSETPQHEVASYRLFPEPGKPQRNRPSLLDFFPPDDQPQTQLLPQQQDINDVNIQIQMSNREDNVPASASSSSSLFSNALAPVQLGPQFTLVNHGRSQSSYLPSHTPRSMVGSMEDFADIMVVQQAYLCALYDDPDEITPVNLLHEAPHAVTNHYATNICQMPHSRESPLDAVTGQLLRITSSSSQMQPSGQDYINQPYSAQGNTRSPLDSSVTFRDICTKGQVADLCMNPSGSRLVQRALEMATPEEIIMVYEEVIPSAHKLATDVFANYVIQKLLEHGPQSCRSKFICNLTGNVVRLSFHIYGCRVIQKAFEVADNDLKLQLAYEFRGKVLKCARDQYANHVLQKCMECVPAQRIQFIFRSFIGNAKAFSITHYGCHIIQKVLTFCNNPEISYKLVEEIEEAAVKLASDPCGNYVVQHVVEHGGPVERSVIVKKLAGQVLKLSYQKYASNVIEKCLAFGSVQDQQLIITEILTSGSRQVFDHLLDMMCHMYATFVIQKLVPATNEEQLSALAEVAHRNMATISRYPHGRHVIAHIQKALTERGMSSDMYRGPSDCWSGRKEEEYLRFCFNK